MVRKDYILFTVLLAALIVAQASASPSIHDNLSVLNLSQDQNVDVLIISQSGQGVESSDSRLARLGEEFVKPSAVFPKSTASSCNGAKKLPAIPAAFFMVLAGFVCVSLVKDRKVWTAALGGLLYLGLLPIQALPQLVENHHIRRIGEHSSCKTDSPNRFENSFEWSGDTEVTRYTGLLHRISSIPDSDGLPVNLPVRLIAAYGPGNKPVAVLRRQCVPAETNNIFPFAIIQNPDIPELSPDCAAIRAGRRVYFSPAFSFSYRPHGPPVFS